MSSAFDDLAISNLSVSKGSQQVLHSVSLSLNTGEMLAIVGPNGAGKTSLLKCLAGLEGDFSGEIRINSKPLAEFELRDLARTIAYLPQQHSLQWPLSVRHVVELGRLPHQGYRRQLARKDCDIVDNAMRLADVIHLADRTANELSGGELARVMLARTFATQASLLLADEPTAALDPYHQLHLMELLRLHCAQGGAAVLVMHDLNLAARYCDRILVLKEGSVVIDGEPGEVLTDQVLAEVYGVSVARFENMIVPQQRI